MSLEDGTVSSMGSGMPTLYRGEQAEALCPEWAA